ncbi:Hint domain-containing protein [Acetobacter sp.]|jgi:autotransporter passenger strand-loop-strand repeat protein|uniref:Hint domain-containing protein n=1 Tax=Acetobacter sp. TaxID=440 RepID=UPI0025C6B281|nr:Hint domain-containing protein [Acetobacter sp.]MCH4092480.1 Hint domain-containing protein [Acetobacter sp.]MCI1299614.1 Hint domain-containing protein [Acetobacter sp.]MCI1315506.1 Hint domain-containing protein [Acetobacter sp.]
MSGAISGANIPSVIYDGGTYEVAAGASVSGITILSGTLNVAGSASGTQLNGSSGGAHTATSEHVLSGGVEYQATASGGFISVASGGRLVSANLEQSDLVVDGGSVNSLSATSGSQVSATNGATINSATMSQYGWLNIDDSSTLENSVVGGGAYLSIEKGAKFENVSLLEAGNLWVSAGSSAGVISGADLEGITFQSGSTIDVRQGTLSDFHLPAGVFLTIGDSNSANNLVVAGTEIVSSMAHDQNSIIQSGGKQVLLVSAVTSGVVVLSGGTQVVSSGGIAFETRLESGGTIYVSSGGSIVNSDDTKLSQGVVNLDGGSVVFTGDTTLSSGVISGCGSIVQEGSGSLHIANDDGLSGFSGTIYITDGEIVVSDITDLHSASLEFMDGHTGSLVISGSTSPSGIIGDIDLGDTIELSSLTWQDGLTTHLEGTNTLQITQPDGAVVGSLNLGDANYTWSSFVLSKGSDGGTVIALDDNSSPGVIANTIFSTNTSNVNVSGTGAVVNGATVSNVSISYASLYDPATTGHLILYNGTKSFYTKIDRNTEEVIRKGASSYNSTVTGGSEQVYGNSYQSQFSTWTQFNFQYVEAKQFIYAGGVSDGATFKPSIWVAGTAGPQSTEANQYIYSGGLARNTTLDGDFYTVGGVLGYTNVLTQSIETIYSGGTAVNTTITQYGVVNAASGATLTSAVLDGGVLNMASGTIISDGLTFKNGTIYITDMKYAAGSALQVSLDDNDNLLITDGDLSKEIHLNGDYSKGFDITHDAQGNVFVTYGTPAPCYCRGTLIDMQDGRKAVEDIVIGDVVKTANGQYRPVRWVGYRAYDGLFARGNPDLIPVIFRKNSLGNGVPVRDLTVSPLHAMFVDGWLIPAHCLVNDMSIVHGVIDERLEYFHIELETHDILLAEGAPAESFVDDQSRNMFHNAHTFHELYPHVCSGEALYCAPRLEEGVILEHIRQKLAGLDGVMETVSVCLIKVTSNVIAGYVTGGSVNHDALVLSISVNGVHVGHVTADQKDADGRRHFVFGLTRSQPLAGDEDIQVAPVYVGQEQAA